MELQELDLLPDRFAVLGVGRTKYGDSTFREMISGQLEKTGEIIPLLHYHCMLTESADDYQELAHRLEQLSSDMNIEPSYLFYLATPPSLYGIIPRFLSGAGLTEESTGVSFEGSSLRNPLEWIINLQSS